MLVGRVGVVVATVVFAAVASSGVSTSVPDDDGNLTVEQLSSDTGECPFDLAAILGAADLSADDTLVVSVDTAPVPDPSAPLDTGLPVLERAGGALVECEQAFAGGGQVELLLFASPSEGAAEVVFLPLVVATLGLGVEEAEIVLDRITDTDAGGIVGLDDLGDLDETGDTALALAPIEVEGAAGAVSSSPSLTTSAPPVRTPRR